MTYKYFRYVDPPLSFQKELKIAFRLRGRTDEVVKSPNKPRSVDMVNSLLKGTLSDLPQKG